ncbi:unnamed protein product [Brassica oleracea]
MWKKTRKGAIMLKKSMRKLRVFMVMLCSKQSNLLKLLLRITCLCLCLRKCISCWRKM